MKFVPLILLLLFASTLVAQDRPKAVLVDEHEQLPCDDSLGRMDLWYAELSNHSDSTGLAVISTSPEQKHQGVFRQRMMEAYARFRGASKALKLKYVRSNATSPLKIQLWRIPSGAGEPEINHIDNSFVLAKDIKPFLLGTDFEYIGDICPGERSDQIIFAEFLKYNIGSRANIVVRERTVERARRKADKIRKTFHSKYSIPTSRLRFFLRRVSASANYGEPIVEYWYLP